MDQFSEKKRPLKARRVARLVARALARFTRSHSRFFAALGMGACAAVILMQIPIVGGALALVSMGVGAVIGLLRELERSLSRLGDDNDDERRAQNREGQNKR